MNSKDALKRIETVFSLNKEGNSNYYKRFTSSIEPYYQDFNLVMKDLEILELLKEDNLLEYLLTKELFRIDNSYCGNTNKERERVERYRNKLVKLKERLENE